MNEYILKVMVWLKNKDFYSEEVMKKNSEDAVAAAAADAAADAAYYAAAAYYADCYSYATRAAYCVYIFFKKTGHKRSQYEQEVNKRLNNENN